MGELHSKLCRDGSHILATPKPQALQFWQAPCPPGRRDAASHQGTVRHLQCNAWLITQKYIQAQHCIQKCIGTAFATVFTNVFRIAFQIDADVGDRLLRRQRLGIMLWLSSLQVTPEEIKGWGKSHWFPRPQAGFQRQQTCRSQGISASASVPPKSLVESHSEDSH